MGIHLLVTARAHATAVDVFIIDALKWAKALGKRGYNEINIFFLKWRRYVSKKRVGIPNYCGGFYDICAAGPGNQAGGRLRRAAAHDRLANSRQRRLKRG
jgi:hypothetical protein